MVTNIPSKGDDQRYVVVAGKYVSDREIVAVCSNEHQVASVALNVACNTSRADDMRETTVEVVTFWDEDENVPMWNDAT